ncbi:MAG: WGR domain-containing protein [Rhodocyclaceae bacterium]|nr:WGR domain-containing protein [Rhodocyclaceae bacterium]
MAGAQQNQIVASAYLEFVNSSSDKFYSIQVRESSDGKGGKVYTTVATYGRNGVSNPAQAQKYEGPSRRAAEAALDKVRKEKLAKGYVETGYQTLLDDPPPQPAQPPAPAKKPAAKKTKAKAVFSPDAIKKSAFFLSALH